MFRMVLMYLLKLRANQIVLNFFNAFYYFFFFSLNVFLPFESGRRVMSMVINKTQLKALERKPNSLSG